MNFETADYIASGALGFSILGGLFNFVASRIDVRVQLKKSYKNEIIQNLNNLVNKIDEFVNLQLSDTSRSLKKPLIESEIISFENFALKLKNRKPVLVANITTLTLRCSDCLEETDIAILSRHLNCIYTAKRAVERIITE